MADSFEVSSPASPVASRLSRGRGARGGAGIRPLAVGRRMSPAEVLAIVWLVVIVLGAVLVDALPLPDPDEPDYAAYLQPPSSLHLLGTDDLGRDILSRLLHGARVSLALAAAAVAGGLLFGLVLGLLAGYFRGWVDRVIAVISDIVLAFPVLILIMVVVAIRGPSFEGLIIGLAVGTAPGFARMARAHTMTWARREFVTASAGLGARHPRLIFGSVLPMVIPPLLVYAFIIAAVVMMAEGALSFLGYGVPPPSASWGSMIASGRKVMQQAPYAVLIPSCALILTVMSLNVLGDRLDRKGGSR